MTAMNWYATELLVEERKHQIERDARLAAARHVPRSGRRTRRYARRR